MLSKFILMVVALFYTVVGDDAGNTGEDKMSKNNIGAIKRFGSPIAQGL
jgi:hypothetical protein